MDPGYCSGIIYACSQATNLSMGCKWLCVESSGGVRVIYISTICCNNKNMHSTNQSYFVQWHMVHHQNVRPHPQMNQFQSRSCLLRQVLMGRLQVCKCLTTTLIEYLIFGS